MASVPRDFPLYSTDPYILRAVTGFYEALSSKQDLIQSKSHPRPSEQEFLALAIDELEAEFSKRFDDTIGKRVREFEAELLPIATSLPQVPKLKTDSISGFLKSAVDIAYAHVDDMSHGEFTDEAIQMHRSRLYADASEKYTADRARLEAQLQAEFPTSGDAYDIRLANRVKDVITRWERDNKIEVSDLEVFEISMQHFDLTISQPGFDASKTKELYENFVNVVDNLFPNREWSEKTRLPHIVAKYDLEGIKSDPGFTLAPPLR